MYTLRAFLCVGSHLFKRTKAVTRETAAVAAYERRTMWMTMLSDLRDEKKYYVKSNQSNQMHHYNKNDKIQECDHVECNICFCD